MNGLIVDGCEYECTATVDMESDDDGTCSDEMDNDCDGRVDLDDPDCSDCYPEYCDELDNDCDEFIDEDFDLSSDPVNCGACGTVCLMRPHAIPACVLGECTIICEAGWVNEDLDDLNGCEGVCVPDIPDESLCDGTDADCDGLVDEDYVPYPCGAGVCETDSVCWAGVEDCVPGLPLADDDTVCDGLDEDCDGDVDEEFVPSDVCIGHCRSTATCVDGAEVCGDPTGTVDTICDGLDDDCDGESDEDYVSYTCGSGGCVRESTCIGGVEDCILGGPAPEICNGSDDDCDGSIDNAPPGDMCPTPPHGDPACIAGVCGVGSCDVGWYDIDGAPINGCECTVESGEIGASDHTSAVSMGDIHDTGASRTVSGNVIPDGDVDWFTFRAVDDPDGGTSDCDHFRVHIEFTANPGNEFRMEIYRAGANYGTGSPPSGTPDCTNEARSYDRDMWHRGETESSSPGLEGECNCSNPETSSYNICDNDTDTYWIKVYRAGSIVTCGDYTIVVTNG
ncbi:MAG: hypothetical protein JRG91_17865 [Deltaproteobacteria bacterium]|nr:hypothetical protein [Deltaproteobacteria bacterium]